MLDMSFSSLTAALGDVDDPLESIAVPRLLAVAYVAGWSSKVLSVTPAVDFAGELEAAIVEARCALRSRRHRRCGRYESGDGAGDCDRPDPARRDPALHVVVWHYRCMSLAASIAGR